MTPERRQLTDPDRIFGLFPLNDDHIVADLGCGNGFFAIPLGRRSLPRLPEGAQKEPQEDIFLGLF